MALPEPQPRNSGDTTPCRIAGVTLLCKVIPVILHGFVCGIRTGFSSIGHPVMPVALPEPEGKGTCGAGYRYELGEVRGVACTCRVWGAECRMQVAGCRVQGAGCGV